MHFSGIQKLIHETNTVNGWWEKNREIPELLCLVHSEISEALEAYRHSSEGQFIKDIPNFSEELADVVIRIMDIAEYFGINLEVAILKKSYKNLNRGYRHGGKRC